MSLELTSESALKEESSSGRKSRILTPPGFLDHIITSFESESQFAGVMTMSLIDDGFYPREVFRSLVGVAERGVEAVLQYDSSSDVCWDAHVSAKPVRFRRFTDESKENYLRTRGTISQAEASGVLVTPTNPLGMLSRIIPIFGREHRKIFISRGNKRAWIPTFNITQLDYIVPGIVLEICDEEVVEELARQFRQVNDKRPTKNQNIDCTPDYSILVDGGVWGSSGVYNQACETVEKGADWFVLITQVLPNFRLLESLIKAAKRGSHVTIITASLEKSAYGQQPYKSLLELFHFRTRSIRKHLDFIHYPDFMHVKALFTPEEAIVGSHNFTESMWLKVWELAIKFRDQDTIKELENYAQGLTSRV